MADLIHLDDSQFVQIFSWEQVVALRFDNAKTLKSSQLTKLRPFQARQLARVLLEAAQKAENHDRGISTSG